MRCRAAVGGVLLLSLGAVSLSTMSPSLATTPAAAPPALVSAVPAAWTPDVGDGSQFSVRAIVQVGPLIVQGGLFDSVTSPGSSTVISRSNLYAASAATGVVRAGFAPTLDGPVAALVAGPVAGTVFVGGSFNTVNGEPDKGLALLRLSDGSLVPGFHPPALDGPVTTMALTGGRLLLGGDFTTLAGVPHAGLGSVSPGSGALDGFLGVQLSGHHNYGVNCTPGNQCVLGRVGATRMAVAPDGRQLTVVGNFTSADGLPRDQIVRVLLGGGPATVDRNWQTDRYHPSCFAFAYDSYVRDVAYSPDGSYVVVVAAGGGGRPDPATTGCDAAARFDTAAHGAHLQPTWLDYAGNDTVFSVAVTAAAVYLGGHERWFNNVGGSDSAGAGAVPRPGIAALDPVNGLPLSWNPGRNPRGARVDVLYPSPPHASPAGLWVGSDTNFIGNRRYHRAKDAFFPDAGGETLPPGVTRSLPANVYLAGQEPGSHYPADTVTRRSYDGRTAGAVSTVRSTATWSAARGAFMVDGTLFFGRDDGGLYSCAFDGRTFGTPVLLDPYDDPAWVDVRTGSPPAGSTYRGAPSGLSSELPRVTGLTYAKGYLFYTLMRDSHLHVRAFSPESGIVGGTETVLPGSVDLSRAKGLFVSGKRLYWADQADGHLMSADFAAPTVLQGRPQPARLTGPAVTADGTTDWRSHALFLGP